MGREAVVAVVFALKKGRAGDPAIQARASPAGAPNCIAVAPCHVERLKLRVRKGFPCNEFKNFGSGEPFFVIVLGFALLARSALWGGPTCAPAAQWRNGSESAASGKSWGPKGSEQTQ